MTLKYIYHKINKKKLILIINLLALVACSTNCYFVLLTLPNGFTVAASPWSQLQGLSDITYLPNSLNFLKVFILLIVVVIKMIIRIIIMFSPIITRKHYLLKFMEWGNREGQVGLVTES